MHININLLIYIHLRKPNLIESNRHCAHINHTLFIFEVFDIQGNKSWPQYVNKSIVHKVYLNLNIRETNIPLISTDSCQNPSDTSRGLRPSSNEAQSRVC